MRKYLRFNFKSSPLEAHIKVSCVISSCENIPQIESARKYVDLYLKSSYAKGIYQRLGPMLELTLERLLFVKEKSLEFLIDKKP